MDSTDDKFKLACDIFKINHEHITIASKSGKCENSNILLKGGVVYLLTEANAML